MSQNSVFLDTNLFVYALTEATKSEDKGKHQKVINLLELLLDQVEIMTSIQVVNECHFVLLRKFKFDDVLINQLIESSIVQICTLLPLEYSTYQTAKRLRQHHQLSFWDSMVCASALLGNCQTLYSEDMQNGMVIDGKMKIVNPFL